MITYNHEEYIREAISSILIQEGDFDLELNIVNDHSEDNTDLVIREMISTNNTPIKINYFCNPKKKGIVENFIYCLGLCHGNYIALCEGDDHWNSKDKLKLQLELIQADQELVMVVHKSKVISDYMQLKDSVIPNYHLPDNIITFQDILNPYKSKACHTSSYFFLRSALNLDVFYECIQATEFGDTPLLALLSTKGKIVLIDQILSTYRRHKKGFSNNTLDSKIVVVESFITMFTRMKKHIDVQYYAPIDRAIKISYYKLATLFFVKENKVETKKYFRLSFSDNLHYLLHNFKSYVLLLAFCYLSEPLYKWLLGKYRAISGSVN